MTHEELVKKLSDIIIAAEVAGYVPLGATVILSPDGCQIIDSHELKGDFGLVGKRENPVTIFDNSF